MAKKIERPNIVENKVMSTIKSDPVYRFFNGEYNITGNEISSLSGKNIYETFSDLEIKDGQVASKVNSRRASISAVEYEIVKSGNDNADNYINSIFTNKKSARKIHKLINALSYSISHGFAVIEIVWAMDQNNRYYPEDFILIPHRRIRFDEDGKPFLKTKNNQTTGIELPESKYIYIVNHPENGYYGRGYMQTVFYLSYIKKTLLEWWLLYNNKFSVPSIIGEYEGNISDQKLNEYVNILQSLQNDSVALIPKSLKISSFETGKNSNADFENFINYLDKMITQTILGNSLTTENTAVGSNALGNIHENIKWDIVKNDCGIISEGINILIQMICDFNFSDINDYPYFRFDLQEYEDLKMSVDIIDILIKSGLKVSSNFLYSKFKIPKPEEGEEIVQPPAQTQAVPGVIGFSETETDNSIDYKQIKQTNKEN